MIVSFHGLTVRVPCAEDGRYRPDPPKEAEIVWIPAGTERLKVSIAKPVELVTTLPTGVESNWNDTVAPDTGVFELSTSVATAVIV